jgi:two-component system LytT family response regulator
MIQRIDAAVKTAVTDKAVRGELFTVSVVDDDSGERAKVAAQIQRDPSLVLLGEFADARDALSQSREVRPDLIVCDIQMPFLDAFEMLDQFSPSERPHVIFVTSHTEYAVRAFEAGTIDFVPKPFSDQRLALALDRAKNAIGLSRLGALTRNVELLLESARTLEQLRPTAAVSAPVAQDHLVIKADGALHFLKTSDVIWIEAQGDFVKVQTSDKTQLVRETLQALERKLDATKFMRIHRSFLINRDHLVRVETALYGDYSVFMSDGSKLRLSRTYRPKLKSLLGRLPPSLASL